MSRPPPAPLAWAATFALSLALSVVACAAPRLQRTPQRGQPRALHAHSPTPPSTAQQPHRVAGPAAAREDPYYWLRDDQRSDPAVLAQLARENAYADALLAPLSEARHALRTELRARIAQEDRTVDVRRGDYLYARRFVRSGEYPLHVRRADRAGAPEQLLLDENALANGTAYFDLGSFEVSPDGHLLAWTEDRVGRGRYTVRFKDLTRDQLLPDTLGNSEAAIAWASDNRTLLYVEKDAQTLLGFRVRKHLLGSEPAHDPVVYEEPNHAFYLAVWRSRSGRFLHIYASATDSSEQWQCAADDPTLSFQRMLPREPNHEYLAEDHGDHWIVRTNRAAPNFRLVDVAPGQLSRPERWRELVAQPERGLLQDFAVFDGFVAYTARVEGLLRAFYLSFGAAAAQWIALPPEAATVQLGDNPEPSSTSVRLRFSSLTVPESDYAYDGRTSSLTLLKQQPVLGGYRSADYESLSVLAPARDGSEIPVSIARRRDLPRDGSAALYQLAYGAYGVSEDPEFSSARVSLLARGVVVAIAHVRGGQELGRAWYERGRQQHKRNSFTDFVDVTDFLLAQRFVSPQRLSARGASAGGLLMGAVANMTRDKYRVIVAHVPFVDVVTTMLDDSIPLTSNELDEWGDPKRAADYAYMLSYSPYDNVQRAAYPALFVSTSLWDSQVQYWEPAKWVARLRERKSGDAPILLRVNMEASHEGRSGRFQRLDQLADEYAFVLDRLGALVPSAGRR